jgi:hypothetical protein
MYARSVILRIPQKTKKVILLVCYFRDASLLLYKGILHYTTKVLFIVHNMLKKGVVININMAISFIPSMPALMHPEQANPLI